MTSNEALITAARRYCQDNHSYWTDRYSKERTGQDFPEYTYSDQDYNLFPRYNVLSAIVGQIEMLVGKTFPDLASCREVLVQIGTSAQSPLTGSDNAIDQAAMEEERNKYRLFIQNISEEELTLVASLPYRRRLNEDERAAVRQQLLERWNYDGEYWDPLVENSPAETLYLSKEQISTADHQSIIDFISTHAQPHLLEVTEDLTDTEIASSEFHPDCYETVYCDYTYSWLIYGSHESTISFAGEELLKFIRQLFSGREHLFNKQLH
jgi:hypothetical protein